MYSKHNEMEEVRTYDEMALLASRNANKHVLLALGVNRTPGTMVKFTSSVYVSPRSMYH